MDPISSLSSNHFYRKKLKKILGILLAVCFLISVTAATVSTKPVTVKEKKTAIIALKDVKITIYKWPYYYHHHHHRHNHKLMKAVKESMNS